MKRLLNAYWKFISIRRVVPLNKSALLRFISYEFLNEDVFPSASFLSFYRFYLQAHLGSPVTGVSHVL